MEARSLQPGRLAARALVGLMSRGSQGVFVASAAVGFDPVDAQAVVLVVGISMSIGMLTNAGIPTLMVRALRSRRVSHDATGLLKAHWLLSVPASGIAAIVVLAMVREPMAAAMAALLCFVARGFFAAEYWAVGSGSDAYDRFLARPLWAQTLTSLLALLGAVVGWHHWVCLGLLVLSYLVGLAFWLPTVPRLAVVRKSELRVREWGSSIGWLALATALGAVVFGMDLYVGGILLSATELVDYRLATLVIAFLVGLLPMSVFVLADSSSGHELRFLLIAVWSLVLVGCAIGAGFIGWHFFPSYTSSALLLVALSITAPCRQLSQVLISELNGKGSYRLVAIGMSVVAAALTAGACLVGLFGGGLYLLCALQISTEALLSLILLAIFLVQRGGSGGIDARLSVV